MSEFSTSWIRCLNDSAWPAWQGLISVQDNLYSQMWYFCELPRASLKKERIKSTMKWKNLRDSAIIYCSACSVNKCLVPSQFLHHPSSLMFSYSIISRRGPKNKGSTERQWLYISVCYCNCCVVEFCKSRLSTNFKHILRPLFSSTSPTHGGDTDLLCSAFSFPSQKKLVLLNTLTGTWDAMLIEQNIERANQGCICTIIVFAQGMSLWFFFFVSIIC